ncbi:MAG: hypothetical protein NTV31_04840 [Bacteroidia bacterium]|nr:hypothetical protein [Bacteroidia bacterium]
MKTLIIVLTIGLYLAVLTPSASAQYSDISVIPILNQAKSKLRQLTSMNVQIARVEFDLIFKDEVKSTTRDLYSHRTYSIVAFGDTRMIKDIDILLYQYDYKQKQWTKIMEDNDADPEAILQFTPSENGTYTIDVKVYSFIGEYTAGHYGLIIYY